VMTGRIACKYVSARNASLDVSQWNASKDVSVGNASNDLAVRNALKLCVCMDEQMRWKGMHAIHTHV
jgi:hypothetical protein